MPLQLTTAIQVGDLADDGPYTHVKIINMRTDVEFETIEIQLISGKIVADKFVRGKLAQVKSFTIRNTPSTQDPAGQSLEAESHDYDEVVSSTPYDGTSLIYDQNAKVLYEWLISKGHYSGTIV